MKKQESGTESGKAAKLTEPFIAYGAQAQRAGVLLGMPRAASKISGDREWIDLIRKGIPKKSFDQLAVITGLGAGEMARVIHLSDRTLRRYEPDAVLPQEQSERMVEVARLYNRGEEVFGSLDRFKEWMSRPQVALGGEMPKSYLDTSLGIRLILDQLGRIEHGIFA
jgi:putative toxin-antitoxin system antitoxin component (TIGR02293 family)